MISSIWYIIFIYVFLFAFCIMLLYRYGVKKYIFTHEKWQHFIIFLQAKKMCKIAAYKNNAVVLHLIFENLFIALKVCSAGMIHEELIEQYFMDKGFSHEQIMQWRIFYSKLLQASFDQYGQSNSPVLFQESLIWLQRLKEKI